MEDYTRAINIYSRLYADALGPHPLANIYCRRGLAYGHMKEYEKAIQDFTKAIELNPLVANYFAGRGVTYFERGNAYRNRGQDARAAKDYAMAILDDTSAIQLDPQNAAYYFNRGSAYASLGKRQEAIRDYEKVLELAKDTHIRADATKYLEELGAR